MQNKVRVAAVLTTLVVVASASHAAGTAPTKEECLEAHGRGQDLREEGKLARARQVFFTCSQSSCPSLVQADCARFGDELGRLVPTMSFAARDTHANDLPSTTVYVDDVLVATRLDEGKSHDVDPGKHVVRFVRDGKEVTVRVVVNQGEKGRNVIATFNESPAVSSPAASGQPQPPEPPPSKPSKFPLLVAGLGGAAAITGGVLFAVGLGKVPSSCSNVSKECAAPPGDRVFDDAHSGVNLANLGLTVGIVGAAVGVAGLVWYFAQPSEPTVTGRTTGPWMTF